MTTLAAFIPRFRTHRTTGRVMAIRCTNCKTWRKPRLFNPRSNTCRDCTYGTARQRLTDRATARR
jgi:hypothetical protein